MHHAIRVRHGFNGAHGGGANAQQPSTVLTRAVDAIRRILRHLIVFAVHDMTIHIFFLDRAEGAKSHMQQHRHHIHAHIAHLLQ